MDVNGIANGLALGLGRTLRPDADTQGASTPPPEVEGLPSTTSTNAQNVVPESSGSSVQRGVIRNLLDNHFSAVAAARLSINFHDELLVAQSASFTATVQDGVNSFIISVEIRVEVFIQGEGFGEDTVQAITAALDEFVGSVRDALDGFLTDNDHAVDALLESIVGALQQFIDDLTSIVAPDSAPAAGTVESNGETAVGTTDVLAITTENLAQNESTPLPLLANLEQLINDLNEFFTNVDEAIANAFETSTARSAEVFESNGNGVAFERFLSILNALEGNDTAPSTFSETSSPEDVL